jgi:hypothetical protein
MCEIALQLAGGIIHHRRSVLAQQFHERALGITRQLGGLPTRYASNFEQLHGQIQSRLVLRDRRRNCNGCLRLARSSRSRQGVTGLEEGQPARDPRKRPTDWSENRCGRPERVRTLTFYTSSWGSFLLSWPAPNSAQPSAGTIATMATVGKTALFKTRGSPAWRGTRD